MAFRSTVKQNPFADADGNDVIWTPAAKAAHAGSETKEVFTHRVTTNRTSRGIGHYASLMMDVQMPYFSGLELGLHRYVDFAVGITSFWAQPLTFRLLIDGELSRYTPDCGVCFEDGKRRMIEAKGRDDANSEQNRKRWPFIKAELAACGFEFQLVTDEFLKREPLASRIEAIQRFRNFPWKKLESAELVNRLSRRSSWTIREVLEALAALGLHRDYLFASVLRRELYVDLDEPIDDDTPVYVARNAPYPSLFRQAI
jgi:hypothetical protein